MVKVLIVDDSAFMRRSLTAILEKDPDIKVIATANDGEQAIRLAREHDPDVITMDVEMPRMNGLTALEHIMTENPCPVIMVSSLTNEGADITLRALELGALDYMPKLNAASTTDIQEIERSLGSKVKALARRKSFMRLVFNRKKTQQEKKPTRTSMSSAATHKPDAHAAGRSSALRRTGFDVVAIGVSTGGPPAVQKILTALPENFPVPILIAQHMPAAFTGAFAKRLNSQCKISVKEAEPVERLKPGTAYICPGGKHLRMEQKSGMHIVAVTEDPVGALYKPSANVLMETVGMTAGRKALGVTLTGMGNDGVEGTKILKEKGGWAIAQSETSCVVYGMPKAVVDAGLADEIVDIDDMAAAIMVHFER